MKGEVGMEVGGGNDIYSTVIMIGVVLNREEEMGRWYF